MNNVVLDEKKLRKRMIDLDIKTINELSVASGVSKPTIYDYINGKTPLSMAFIKLCEFLNMNPIELLDSSEPAEEKDNV